MDMMLEQFKVIFDRPEKVKKLREIILELAVRGKLVNQNPNDEPARVLIEKIKEEKEILIREKNVKKEKPFLEVSKEEKFFDLPCGWEWIRFNDVMDVRDGTHDTPKYFKDGIPLVTSKNISSGKLCFDNVKYISYEDHEKISQRSKVDNGDILFAMIGSIGNPVIIDKDRDFSIKNVALFKFYNCNVVDRKYSYYYLKFAEKIMKRIASGAVQSFVSLKVIRNFIFALPPLEEQKRIVEKVDSMMDFCDKLEKVLEKKVYYGELSAKSVFNAVGNVSSVEQIEEILRFILLNFKELSLGDNAVKELKNCILQLAIQGKLVPQNEKDESAEILTERIKKEKQRLVMENKIKKERSLIPISEEEKPFKLPSGWQWVRLNDISAPENYSFVDGPFGSNLKKEHYTEKGIRVIQLQNVGEGFWKNSSKVYISDEKAKELIRCNSYPGEIVIAKMAPTGRATIIPDFDNKYVLCSDCVKLKPYVEITNEYIKYLMNSLYVKKSVMNDSTGITRQRTSLGKLKALIIPLPPKEEQKRIVEKVNSLMELCDELEKKIEKSKKYNERLMESIFRSSFSN